MKRKRLSHDSWKCILSKDMHIAQVSTEFFTGHMAFMEVKDITGTQTWEFRGENIVVCDKGMKWLSILPQNDFYCITAMMDEKDTVILWYIDMIATQGVDADGVPWFDDLYLDLVVYADGTAVVDDMDELEAALAGGDITHKQFELALETCERLKAGVAKDVESLMEYTQKVYDMVKCCGIMYRSIQK